MVMGKEEKKIEKCLGRMDKNALFLNIKHFNVCLGKVIPLNELV